MNKSSPSAESTNITPSKVCDEMLSLLLLHKSHLFALAEEHGLTHVQVHTLRIIADGQNAMGKIAKVMHCDASNITGIIDRLISLELVTRQEDEKDRRIKTIALTPKGKSILDNIIEKLPSRVGWDSLSNKELIYIHRIIQKLSMPDTKETA